MEAPQQHTSSEEPADADALMTDRPHPARIYDALLGGKTNYAADRQAAERLLASFPLTAVAARQNRAFVHRAARALADEGIRQFLDIGTGIPTSPNLHEVVQAVTPEARVVYADNDPIVLAHSRALHDDARQGRTAYVQADLCDPDGILGNDELRSTLDFTEPVAVTVIAVLHWLPKHADPYDIVGRLLAPLPAGSALALTHGTADFDTGALQQASDTIHAAGNAMTYRTEAEVRRFFDGMELLDPGISTVHKWRPDESDIGARRIFNDADIPLYAGVGRKR